MREDHQGMGSVCAVEEWQHIVGKTFWPERVLPNQSCQICQFQGITDEPAFTWWVHHILKSRDHIVATVNKCYHKWTHKFGFKIPKTIIWALEIDQETYWRDAIAKEMDAVWIAFQITDLEDLPGYQFMECHMIFEIKLNSFWCKAWLGAGGHMTDAPAVMTYASIISRETVWIALTLAANDVDIKASDIQNVYVTAPCEENIWTTLGPEFGVDGGKKAIITCTLYGLNRSGGSFNQHIADCMWPLGYKPCKASPDLWLKPMVQPDDGFKYYAYILLYVNDCLTIHHDTEMLLHQLDHYFMMKKG